MYKHACSSESSGTINKLAVAIIGIAIAPTSSSAMAMLESTMLECFCSSFLPQRIEIIVMSEAINTITAEI